MTLGRWVGLIALIVSLYILWQIRSTVLLFFAATLFAIGLNRIVKRLQKSRVRRGVAIVLTIGIVVAVLGILLTFITVPLIDQLAQLIDLIPVAIQQLTLLGYRLQDMVPGSIIKNLPSITDLTQQLQNILNWTLANVYLFFSNTLALLLNTLLIVVLTLMLLANPQQYRNVLVRIFPAFYRSRVDEILSECEARLVSYIGGIALSMAFIGVTSTIGLFLLGAPLPLVNGLLAGLSAFIPYLGAIMSVVPPMLLALINDPWKAVFVVLLYFVIQQIEGNFVTPIIMKNQVSLLPASTLALLTAFGTFFGFLGLLLGLPVLVIAQTWLKEVVVKDVLDQWQSNSFK